MKKLILVAVVLGLLGLATSAYLEATSVSSGEKDTFIEDSTKLQKATNLLVAARVALADDLEVVRATYLAARQTVSDNHQPGIDALVAEIASIEASLEGIK